MLACARCGQDNPDVARFCLACGEPLLAPELHGEERKIISVLFTDVVGSTAKAEHMDPEDVRARLEPYYTRVRAELERFGGTVEKFIGDAVVALFGAPVSHEDDPERAVRAALAICAAIEDLNAADEWLALEVRIGVNTGEALVVLGARTSEGEGTAAGDVMNTAARLQSAAPVNGILVGEATYRATRDAIEYREAAPVAAKGKSEPVPVWEVVGVRAEPARERPVRSPLVGRGRELERVLALWERVRAERRPSLLTLSGPAGIGKSRLVDEAAARAAGTGAVYRGRCLSYGEGITYWPIASLVRDAAGILQSDDAGLVSLKLGLLLERLPTTDLEQLRTIAVGLATLVGTVTTPRGTYSTESVSQAELHWGIRRLFELLAELGPVLLVLEDLHWAEPTLLEAIDYLVAGETPAPLLVLASARPELVELQPAFLAERPRRTTVELEALTEAESEALLAELLRVEGSSPAALPEALLRKASGNPLFLEETVRMLLDAGAQPDEALETLPVPSSLQALIGSRLDSLPPPDKRVAQHASVAGAVFWSGAVRHLLESPDGVDAELDALARRDVVRRQEPSSLAGEREWTFKHILIRDVAYGRVPKGRRAALHLRFADWLGALPAGDEEFVEIVAYHLEQSCRLAREVARTPVEPPVAAAVAALTRAAEKAERQEGIRVADRFYARALEIVGEDADEALELRLRRGRMQMILGDLRRAREQLLAVAEDARAAGRPDVRCPALITLANVDFKQGRAADVRIRLDEAARLAEQLGDHRLRVGAAYESANRAAWFDGDHDGAIRELELGLALAGEIDDRTLRIEGHLRLGTVHTNAGRLSEAERQFELARGLASGAGSYRDEVRATFVLAFVRYYLGDPAETEQLTLRARTWLERLGDRYLQLQSLRLLARFAMRRNDLAAAEDYLQQAVPLALETGGWIVSETYRYLVEVLLRQGRLDDAGALAGLLHRDLPSEDVYARAAADVTDGMVAAAAGDGAESAAAFGRAIELLGQLRNTIDLAEARVCFARCLRTVGAEEDAERQYGLATEAFAAVGATNAVAEIELELGETARGRVAPAPRAS